MEQKLTAFEILQSKLTIADTSEFRLTHIPEILEAMEEYKAQLPQQEISDEEIEKGAKEWYNKEGAYSASAIALKTWVYAIRWYREQLKQRQ
jgi:hypothetical protein